MDQNLLGEYIHTSHNVIQCIQHSFEQSWCGSSRGKQSELVLQGLQIGHILLFYCSSNRICLWIWLDSFVIAEDTLIQCLMVPRVG